METIDSDDESNYIELLDQTLDSPMSGMEDERNYYTLEKRQMLDVYRNVNINIDNQINNDIYQRLRNLIYEEDISGVKELLDRGLDPNFIPVIFSFKLSNEMLDLLLEYGANPYSKNVHTYDMWPFINKGVTFLGQINKRKNFVDSYLKPIKDLFPKQFIKSLIDELHLQVRVEKTILTPELKGIVPGDLSIYDAMKKYMFSENMTNGEYKITNKYNLSVVNGNLQEITVYVETKEIEGKDLQNLLKCALFYEKFDIVRYLLTKTKLNYVESARDIIKFLSNHGETYPDIARNIVSNNLIIDIYYLHNTKAIEKLVNNGLIITETNIKELINNNRYDMYSPLLDILKKTGAPIPISTSEKIQKTFEEKQKSRRIKFEKSRMEMLREILGLNIFLAEKIIDSENEIL